jgi:MFS family permease
VLPGVLAFVVLAAVLRGKREHRAGTRPHAAATGAEPAAAKADPGLRPAIVALAALAAARLPETLLLLRLQDLGVAVAAIPLVWAALHVVRTAGSYPGGALADRIGARGTVALGGAVFALVVAALGAALAPAPAIGIFLALGLVAGLVEPAERATVARLSAGRTGRGFGAYHAVAGVAALPAGVLFGWVYQHTGGPAALWLSAGATTAAALGWIAVAPRPSSDR